MAKMTKTQINAYKKEALKAAKIIREMIADGAAEYELHTYTEDGGEEIESLLGYHSVEDKAIQGLPLYDPARGLTTRTFDKIEYYRTLEDGVTLFVCSKN